MSSEEVRSILAGFHPRTKRRGNDRINLRQFNGRVADSGGSGGSGGRRPGSAQDHTKAEKNTARHVAAHHKNTSHGGPGPHKQRNNANVVTAGGNGGRSTNHHSPVSKGGGGGGGSSIGTGGMGKGDGSVGHAVHLAAVESVESFLGDFVPEVRAESPAVVAVLSASTGLETDGNGGVDGHDGGDGAVPKKVSKWAAIGRGGKMSARATAVCVEEVRREGLGCLDVPLFVGLALAATERNGRKVGGVQIHCKMGQRKWGIGGRLGRRKWTRATKSN